MLAGKALLKWSAFACGIQSFLVCLFHLSINTELSMTYLERAIRDGHAKLTGEGKTEKITYIAVMDRTLQRSRRKSARRILGGIDLSL